ncbi:hypothetical protein Mp_2g10450 [Marchantia polymorpha subsp. ruderalis]|uniref:Uncharacterized protein n=1 Tax=Marchantia polymorpha TaxID=3197 RepID=A0A2R6XC33_MARPO|nr:hypothetical protein MARPO_0023s0014 [Marchantia polymorpha]BBN01807.1 hypothetical protein Mp_2g10450 [Marchantia polymorpha subsp. ruderalis]PTQ43671.1 hypothetical protein MARPO_0023s0014 [Marchantia polymorpha]PTQ43672.1 hypothetical protein MARPO_0023s0014 [Marchantia polymorpha]PTQ43673.1 hypothetical protein MARPO_0023s0014 [Marchantia polymorpha]|eukprot:PTQ43670.1 hypothetical protein MARPO_0023s0014 [Marchantia polymorpha]
MKSLIDVHWDMMFDLAVKLSRKASSLQVSDITCSQVQLIQTKIRIRNRESFAVTSSLPESQSRFCLVEFSGLSGWRKAHSSLDNSMERKDDTACNRSKLQ